MTTTLERIRPFRNRGSWVAEFEGKRYYCCNERLLNAAESAFWDPDMTLDRSQRSCISKYTSGPIQFMAMLDALFENPYIITLADISGANGDYVSLYEIDRCTLAIDGGLRFGVIRKIRDF